MLYMENREKPQGGGAFFSLVEWGYPKKKAPPPIFIIPTQRIFIENHEIQKGWDFFFDFEMRLAQKKPHPPVAFRQFPL